MTEIQATIWVAIIMAAGSLIGTIFTLVKGARKTEVEAQKTEVDALRGVIQELRAYTVDLKDYVSDLECDKEDLQTWAERLVCQVKELGHEPVKFIRSDRKTQPRQK